jgi:hypothetical protein
MLPTSGLVGVALLFGTGSIGDSRRVPNPRWKVPPPEKNRATMGLFSPDSRVPIRSFPASVNFPHDL